VASSSNLVVARHGATRGSPRLSIYGRPCWTSIASNLPSVPPESVLRKRTPLSCRYASGSSRVHVLAGHHPPAVRFDWLDSSAYRPLRRWWALSPSVHQPVSQSGGKKKERKCLGLLSAKALVAALAPLPSHTPVDQCSMPDEELLAAWLRPRRPRAVTIARSIDGFMPFACAEPLEAAVLRALKAAFNATLRVEYLPGTAPLEALRAVTLAAQRQR